MIPQHWQTLINILQSSVVILSSTFVTKSCIDTMHQVRKDQLQIMEDCDLAMKVCLGVAQERRHEKVPQREEKDV